MVTLYVGHAQSHAPMTQYDYPGEYVDLFRELKPQEVPAAVDDTDKTQKKHFILTGAIGGKMKPNSAHANSNTLGRDLLPLDFDSIDDETSFLQSIHDKLDGRMSYVLYKTFSYRPDNVRYRLLVPLDRMITRPEEFNAIMAVLARVLHTELDEASTRWGQIFFLPVKTEYNADSLIQVHDGFPLIVDSWLEKILKTPELQPIKEALVATPKVAYAPPAHETKMGFALDRIAAGSATLDDLKTLGRFFDNIGMTGGEKERWFRYFESLQPEPLRTHQSNVDNDTAVRPEQRHRWATMFRDIIDGLAEHDGRNDTMFIFASYLLDERVKAETFAKFTTDANQRNRPPMGNEFIETINSAIERKEREEHRKNRFDF